MQRRSFIQKSMAGLIMANMPASLFSYGNAGRPIGIGICDWNLGLSADPSSIPLAEKLGFQAIQVSVGTRPDNMPLRNKSVRQHYIEMGKKHNIQFCSVAAGGILNTYALVSEPQSVVFVIDALEAARVLGAHNILMAFFGSGHLLKRDSDGNFIKKSSGTIPEYEWKENDIERLIALMKQLIPRAEDNGVIIGMENTLSASQNLSIIEEIGSPMVQVYYDTGNSWGLGYDVPGEIKQLGNDRICEVHIKNRGSRLIYSDEGEVNMELCARALHDINYDKWLVLETSGRENMFEEDTRANIKHTRDIFF
jgi:L-ribulose-5-phosphate 3-epimerase